jgi:hypothetical protein
LLSHPVEEANLVVDLLLSFGGKAVDEIVDRLNAVPVSVVHGLHDGSLGIGNEPGDFEGRDASSPGRFSTRLESVLCTAREVPFGAPSM